MRINQENKALNPFLGKYFRLGRIILKEWPLACLKYRACVMSWGVHGSPVADPSVCRVRRGPSQLPGPARRLSHLTQ